MFDCLLSRISLYLFHLYLLVSHSSDYPGNLRAFEGGRCTNECGQEPDFQRTKAVRFRTADRLRSLYQLLSQRRLPSQYFFQPLSERLPFQRRGEDSIPFPRTVNVVFSFFYTFPFPFTGNFSALIGYGHKKITNQLPLNVVFRPSKA